MNPNLPLYSRTRTGWRCVLGGILTGLMLTAGAETPPVPVPARSPVDLFRELLAATPERRAELLAGRPPAARALIEAKLKEFETFGGEAEIRLRLAQLQFFLSPLLRATAEQRAALLERAPAEDRDMLRERLKSWDALSADTRREILESERSLQYFVRQETADPKQLTTALERAPEPSRPEIEAQFARWRALSPEERARRTAQFQRFFGLSENERLLTLRRLPDSERQQMERSLARFSSLPPEQREQCLRAFRKLSELSEAERTEFLNNAAKWQAMSAPEREAWRKVVQKVSGPPLPPPRLPVPTPRSGGSAVATTPDLPGPR